MWSLPPTDSAESLSNRLHTTWQEQVALAKAGKKSKASLKMAIFKAYGAPYVTAGILKALYDSLSFLQPQLLRILLSFVSSYGQDTPMPPVAGFAISVAMFITANVATAFLHQYFDRCFATSEFEPLRYLCGPADFRSYEGQRRSSHLDLPKDFGSK
jgi:ATP-binding cassette subfamily C (CFTR/MRP) protein 1